MLVWICLFLSLPLGRFIPPPLSFRRHGDESRPFLSFWVSLFPPQRIVLLPVPPWDSATCKRLFTGEYMSLFLSSTLLRIVSFRG